MVEIMPLGGSQEVGRNCFFVEVDKTKLILDMGFHLENFIDLSEDDFLTSKNNSLRRFINGKAIPNIKLIRQKRKQIDAIICSHAHLDHIAAIPFLISKFRCPIYATPFTSKLIRSLCQEKELAPKIIEIMPGETFQVNSLDIEFVPVAHSTPQSVAIAIHSLEGVVLYANDYKEDHMPPFETPTDIDRLKDFSGKTKALILDSLYASTDEFSKSESLAREQVLDLSKQNINSHRAIIATTFASHIYRLQTLVDLADTLNREVVFIGRSLCRYIQAAKDSNVLDLTTRGKLLNYKRKVVSFFKKPFNPKDYFFIVTGHQGEPNAVLSRMAEGLFSFTNEDVVIYSSNVIPVPISISNRDRLDSKLISLGVSIIKDVHVSGHAHGNDHRKLISLLKPEFLFPVHGMPKMQDAMIPLAKNLGVKNVFSLKVGEKFSTSFK